MKEDPSWSDRLTRIGSVPSPLIESLEWPSDIFTIDTTNGIVIIHPPPGCYDSSRGDLCRKALTHALYTFFTRLRTDKPTLLPLLDGWRNEEYPVYSDRGSELFCVERAAAPLLGIVQYGVHLTAFVIEPDPAPLRLESKTGPSGESTAASTDADPAPRSSVRERMRIFVPTRSHKKQTYPGMLDNTVAGGLPKGEDPLDAIVREAWEEASLPEDLVRERIEPMDFVSYAHVRGWTAVSGSRERHEGHRANAVGYGVGCAIPEVEFIYDLDLSGLSANPETLLGVNDGEVQRFELLSVDEVERRLGKGRFKTNCALVLVEFLQRRGMLRGHEAEESSEMLREIKAAERSEISSRSRRRLELPVTSRVWSKKSED